MTHEEIEQLLAQAEAENKKGNFDLTEKLANEVLAELEEIPLNPLRSLSEVEMTKEEENSPPVIERRLVSVVEPSRNERGAGGDLTAHARLRARTLLSLADTALQKGDFHRTLDRAQSALKIAENHHLPDIKAKCHNTCGIVYVNLGKYDQALEYYAKALAMHEELGEKSGVARVTGNIGLVYEDLGKYEQALEYFGKALATHEELGAKSSVASVTGNIGNVYLNLGNYEQALEYYGKALATHEELGEKSGVASVTGNIGGVYADIGKYEQALEYMKRALATHEGLGEKSGVASFTGNIGEIYRNLGKYEQALEYYARTLATFEEIGDKSGVAHVTGNTGIVYKQIGNYEQALEYYGKALATHEELGEKSGIAHVTGYIGSVYAKQDFDGYDAEKAEEYLLKAVAINTEISARKQQYEFHESLAELYEKQERWKESQTHFKKYHELFLEVQSEETKKQAQKFGYERQIAVMQKEQEVTDVLLHKFLPSAIVPRVKRGEEVIAEPVESCSIMFADMVGFTQLSLKIEPPVMMKILNNAFKHFDSIMEKHGCERTRTMGDGYLAVCGAPVPVENHALRLTKAAMEMLDYLPKLQEDFSRALPDEEVKIGLRIGLNCGAVVCGVVGTGKYQFDIYGDAINTAARMESHGEAGKIHCTEEFVKNLTQTLSEGEGLKIIPLSFGEGQGVRFIPRGEIEVKGKGKMRTYFLEKLG